MSGPFSGDTVFLRAHRGEFDVVVACYHDQGLIPVKLLAFGEAVNVTLGLAHRADVGRSRDGVRHRGQGGGERRKYDCSDSPGGTIGRSPAKPDTTYEGIRRSTQRPLSTQR